MIVGPLGQPLPPTGPASRTGATSPSPRELGDRTMATATKKTDLAVPLVRIVVGPGRCRLGESIPAAGCSGSATPIYRFLASLKLAVFSIGDAGGGAGLRHVLRDVVRHRGRQEWIYRSKGFAILLAFLGTTSSVRP